MEVNKLTAKKAVAIFANELFTRILWKSSRNYDRSDRLQVCVTNACPSDGYNEERCKETKIALYCCYPCRQRESFSRQSGAYHDDSFMLLCVRLYKLDMLFFYIWAVPYNACSHISVLCTFFKLWTYLLQSCWVYFVASESGLPCAFLSTIHKRLKSGNLNSLA